MFKNGSSIILRELSRDSLNPISKSLHRMDISGIWPPIPTPFETQSPADKSNQRIPAGVNYDAIRNNIQKWSSMGFRGLTVQGSNGSYPYLSTSERVELVEMVREIIDDIQASKIDANDQSDPLLLMAGAGAESTLETQRMCDSMALAGADCFLVVTPFFYKNAMTPKVLIDHFNEVADFAPKPVIIYNVPANTGLDMSAEAIAELADHPNICGVKDSGGDIAKIGQILHLTNNKNFQVLAGSASFLFSSIALGASGGVCALANVLGQECVSLYDLTVHGQYQPAAELQKRLIAPNQAVTKQFGVPGLKVAMEHFGMEAADLRAPLQPLSDSDKQKVLDAFSKNGFLPRKS